MAASAWVCMVAALPWALSILKSSAVRPAASKALARYGRSKDSYRADVVVSGSRTAILPVPWDARSLSLDIAEKSAVNDVAVISSSVPDPPAVVSVVSSDESPHAARVSAAIETPTRAIRLSEALTPNPLYSRCPWSDTYPS